MLLHICYSAIASTVCSLVNTIYTVILSVSEGIRVQGRMSISPDKTSNYNKKKNYIAKQLE